MQVWWLNLWSAVRSEFSDLDEIGDVVRVTLRLIFAAILGGLLGYQRERSGKPAGLRTHMLVAIGACLFVMVPQQAGATTGEIARVLQGLIAGIGFLGAGSIMKSQEQGQIQGLTTAAGIWLTAAIGMAVGLGRESTAGLSTALALAILGLLPPIERWQNPSPAGQEPAIANPGEGPETPRAADTPPPPTATPSLRRPPSEEDRPAGTGTGTGTGAGGLAGG